MIQKIKKKLKNMLTKLKNLNALHGSYILGITFLSVVILKINTLLSQIPTIYLYIVVILMVLLFKNQQILTLHTVKNTYIFNLFLYYFLILKNKVYGTIFEYFEFVEGRKYRKIVVFMTGFNISSWSLHIFFFIFNHFYNLLVLLFFILSLMNLINFIEKKIIFTPENLNKKNISIDYREVQKILNIDNSTFSKNRSLFYIQKWYIDFHEVKSFINKYGIAFMIGVCSGSFSVGYLNYLRIKLQMEKIEFKKLQHRNRINLQREQILLEKRRNRFDSK